MNYCEARARTALLNEQIFQNLRKIYHLRKLQCYRGEDRTLSAYAITLRKIPEVPATERAEEFHALLNRFLLPGERLELRDRQFRILGDGYEIVYILEAYKKNADQVLYIENGKGASAILRRMSVEFATRLLMKKLETTWYYYRKYNQPPTGHICALYSQMNTPAMMEACPDPAERFVTLIKREVSKDE